MNAPPIKVGDLLEGKFRIERVLGEGGMGIVVAATHVQLDQLCAIKFLLPHALEHPQIVERFEREARAACKVSSPHVAQVKDVGRMSDGAPYMIMEYLDGEDLEHTLLRRGPLAFHEAVHYVLEACEAVAEAHAAGIVHRDLKPANLFLAKQKDRTQIVKVLDFGISKLQDAGSSQLTKTSTAMGTPYYMSPEQLMNAKGVDARSDIWSIGIILYELVSAKRPFEADSMPEIVAKILSNQPVRLTELRPDIPLEFEAAIFKCFSSRPEDRFQSVAELARAIGPFAEEASQASVGIISRVLGGASIPPAPSAPAVGGKHTMPEFNQTRPTGTPGSAPGSAPAVPNPATQIAGSAKDAALGSTQLAADSAPSTANLNKPKRGAAPLFAGAAVVLALATGAIYMKMGNKTGADTGPVASTSALPTAAISVAPTATTPPALTVAALPTGVPTSVVGTVPTSSASAGATAVAGRPGTIAVQPPPRNTATVATPTTAAPATTSKSNPLNMPLN